MWEERVSFLFSCTQAKPLPSSHSPQLRPQFSVAHARICQRVRDAVGHRFRGCCCGRSGQRQRVAVAAGGGGGGARGAAGAGRERARSRDGAWRGRAVEHGCVSTLGRGRSSRCMERRRPKQLAHKFLRPRALCGGVLLSGSDCGRHSPRPATMRAGTAGGCGLWVGGRGSADLCPSSPLPSLLDVAARAPTRFRPPHASSSPGSRVVRSRARRHGGRGRRCGAGVAARSRRHPPASLGGGAGVGAASRRRTCPSSLGRDARTLAPSPIHGGGGGGRVWVGRWHAGGRALPSLRHSFSRSGAAPPRSTPPPPPPPLALRAAGLAATLRGLRGCQA